MIAREKRGKTGQIYFLSIRYGYNGKGERVRKTNGASITLYHYDETGNLLLETNGAGSALVEYIWLGSQRIAMVQGGSVYFTHSDHLGTPQLLTNSAGTVVWAADYKPFGEATMTTATIENNLRFPGQYYDAETQLHYNYFRDYDPTLGRYIQSDPIGLDGGVNTYVYANLNPTINTDPKGLESCSYYDTLCKNSKDCNGNEDCYACNARKCCESFEDNRANNCTRDCLIRSDRQCSKLSGQARSDCRYNAHVICYATCVNIVELIKDPTDKPECQDAMACMK
jgi:RHS repeat-associated protein